ncbi:hypothetical protein N7539_005385 [Penicillium diatomitis]|uniref:Uncharacterized protein n=1 Tax=Penicillium diatomitis TaxID=2819901 RepID=A0A9W9X6W4_9EURO|nr:uncharacterized protein N7539_005385 [Penicillium diatomitis]KAJ5485397.1 hypothetical protein N7539_005385 [Penicillium diatomitis]
MVDEVEPAATCSSRKPGLCSAHPYISSVFVYVTTRDSPAAKPKAATRINKRDNLVPEILDSYFCDPFWHCPLFTPTSCQRRFPSICARFLNSKKKTTPPRPFRASLSKAIASNPTFQPLLPNFRVVCTQFTSALFFASGDFTPCTQGLSKGYLEYWNKLLTSRGIGTALFRPPPRKGKKGKGTLVDLNDPSTNQPPSSPPHHLPSPLPFTRHWLRHLVRQKVHPETFLDDPFETTRAQRKTHTARSLLALQHTRAPYFSGLCQSPP